MPPKFNKDDYITDGKDEYRVIELNTNFNYLLEVIKITSVKLTSKPLLKIAIPKEVVEKRFELIKPINWGGKNGQGI